MTKLEKAKLQVALSNPFFATFLLRRKIEVSNEIKDSATNGEVITINEDFINKCTDYEAKLHLLHSSCGIAFGHHLRREGRDYKKWNEASDYVINAILKADGHTLPKDWLYKKDYENMSVEDVYKLIYSDNNHNPPGQNQVGDINDNCNSIIQQDLDKKKQDLKQEVAQATQLAKMQGKMPGEILRMIEEQLYNTDKWRELLAAFLTDNVKEDYSFKKPNTRYLHTGFILPGLDKPDLKKIILCVDTSMSMDEELLNKIGSEIKDMAESFKVDMYVIYCDTKVYDPQIIECGDVMNLTPMGGGGTKYAPAFEHIEENDVEGSCIVYFTDGECNNFPKNEPSLPTLWAKYGNSNFEPPFGEVIKIN